MKLNLSLIVLAIFAFTANFQAQNKPKEKFASQLPISKGIQVRAVSVGVINGKAINLVKPDYPRAASVVNARGAVNVQVLINEKGNIVEAKAVSGHPLLHAASIAAALKSTFEPVTLSGRKINVWGVIVYNYSSDFFNWLEIGNNFESNRLPEMLPFRFEEEKLLYKKYQADNFNQADFQNILKAIENKLSADKKSLWLFQTGILLNKLQFGFPGKEQLKLESINLKNHISGAPNNVSPFLISKLKNLLNSAENPELNTYSPQNGSGFHEQINEIIEKMFLLGN